MSMIAFEIELCVYPFHASCGQNFIVPSTDPLSFWSLFTSISLSTLFKRESLS